MEARNPNQLYLLNYDESHIGVGDMLPSNAQVLRVLFYNLRKGGKLNLRDSAYIVIREVEAIWNKALIPIRRVDKCVSKLESLYSEYRVLQKTCTRRTLLQEKREQDFIDKFDDLFDIAHINALEMISNAEDKLFLLNQRQKGRPLPTVLNDDDNLDEIEETKKVQHEQKNCKRKYVETGLQVEIENIEFSETPVECRLADHIDEDLVDPISEEPVVGKQRKR